MTKPKVVYWTNQPTPYSVGRLNAVHATGALDLQVWFDESRQSDRSWEVRPQDWQFLYRWVPMVRIAGRTLRVPVDLLRSERPDLVVQLFDRPGTAVGALMTRAYARRLTYRVLPAYQSWGQDTLTTRTAKRFLFRASDGAKVPGPAGEAMARRWGIPPSRCHRVRQTIDVDHFSGWVVTNADIGAIRARSGLKETTFLFVGRLWKGKGLDHLIPAFERLRAERDDVSLAIVGDGVDEAAYRARCTSVPDLHLLGFVQPADLPAYYRAADVLVFPTLGDPHGLVVEEAMSAGLAVITSDAAGDIRDRVELPGAGLVVPAEQIDPLYRAMSRLAADRALRESFACAAVRAVRDLRHPAYALDFVAFVHAVLAAPRRRSVSSALAATAGRVAALSARHIPFDHAEPRAEALL